VSISQSPRQTVREEGVGLVDNSTNVRTLGKANPLLSITLSAALFEPSGRHFLEETLLKEREVVG
jgi:hypothetical protein